MDETISTLRIEIGASSGDAKRQIDEVTRSLRELKKAADQKLNIGTKKVADVSSKTHKIKVDSRDVDKATKKVGALTNILNSLKRIAFYRIIRSAIKAIGESFRQGAENAYWYAKTMGDQTKYIADAYDQLASKSFSMSNQLGAAWATLKATITPILIQIISLITAAANAITQFFALLGGKTTYLKAIDYTKDWADATAGGAEAAEEWKNQLMGFDEINRLDAPSEDAGGGGAIPDYANMFEEVPIDIFDGIKDIFADLITDKNIKIAWDDGLAKLVDAFKNAFEKIKALFKRIWDDIVKVFNSGRGAETLQHIFNILSGIVELAGILAERFRIAWETNDVGLHIIEHLWDVLNIILGAIEKAVDLTVEWAKTLDFYPALASIEKFTAALIPLVKVLTDDLLWAYEHIMLPIAKWAIEEAAPASIDLLTSAMVLLTAVIEKLGPVFEWLYTNILEPFGTWVANTFLNVIRDLTDTFNGLAEKISNASSLSEFLMSLDGKEKIIVSIATAVGALAVALAALKIGEIVIGGLTKAFTLLTSPVGLAALALSGLILVGISLYQNFEEVREIIDGVIEKIKGLGESFSEYLKTFEGLSFDEIVVKLFKDLATAIQNVDWGEAARAIFTVIKDAFKWAFDGIKSFLKELDFASIATSFFELLGSAFGGLLSMVVQIGKDVGESIIKGIKQFLFGDTEGSGMVIGGEGSGLRAIGKSLIEGIQGGIIEKLGQIAEWCKTNIRDPFINGFKNAFGIHSPAKEMEPIGKDILEGVLEGIKSVISEIGAWIEKNVWAPFKTAMESIFGASAAKVNMGEFGENIINGIYSGIESILTGVAGWVSTNVWTPFKSGFELLFGESQANARLSGFGINVINGLRNGILRGLVGLGGWIAGNIWAPIAEGLNQIMSNIASWWSGVQSFFANASSSIATAMTTLSTNADAMAERNMQKGGGMWAGLNAEGGIISSGQVFIARENGLPELVGSFGNRTGVINNEQIVAAVSEGVFEAVVSAMGGMNAGNDKEVVINLDGREIARSTTAYQRQTARAVG